MQLCSKPGGHAESNPRPSEEGVSFYLVLRPLDQCGVLCVWRVPDRKYVELVVIDSFVTGSFWRRMPMHVPCPYTSQRFCCQCYTEKGRWGDKITGIWESAASVTRRKLQTPGNAEEHIGSPLQV